MPAWFGLTPSDLNSASSVSYDLPNSHVFSREEWLPFILAMQAAQTSGNGSVVFMNHTTVVNPKHGIQAGRVVQVMWIYLGKLLNFPIRFNLKKF